MSGEKLPDINSNANLLNKWGILALGVGGCIGSGVISLLGYGIGRTGHSVASPCCLLPAPCAFPAAHIL